MTASAIQLFSVPARSMLFRDCHMRSDPQATRDQVTVAANCLLVKNAGPENRLTVLCDSGPGLQLPATARAKLGIQDEDILMANLEALGVTPEEIDVYLPSHLHWDHTGWAFEGGVFKFPNAYVIMSRQARDDNARVTTDNDLSFLTEAPAILDSLEAEGRLTLLDAPTDSLSEDGITVVGLGNSIQFFFSRGHSDGQMHAAITAQFGTIIFGGDFWPTAWHAVDAKRYMPEFDRRDTAQLLSDKAEFLPRVVQDGLYLYFYHDPETLAAQVIAGSDGLAVHNALTSVQWG